MSNFNRMFGALRRWNQLIDVNEADEREIEEDTSRQIRATIPSIQEFLTRQGPNCRRVISRDRLDRHNEIMKDYLNDDARYPADYFRRRFRMRKELFLQIAAALEQADPYFTQRPDCTGKLGLSSVQKVMAAIRLLAYGGSMDRLDELIKIGETTTKDTVIKFCETIYRLYATQYLRSPNEDDLARLLDENNERGFPGMIGSLDCMHWEWQGCPTSWHGQFKGHKGAPTLVLEAVASHDLWIWHAFFGMAGTMNDISVLIHSPLFDEFIKGNMTKVNYIVNNNAYSVPYYLTDGIYPKYATLIQSVAHPRNAKESIFKKAHEAARKDIERCFGVLQQKWQITQFPIKWQDPSQVQLIMLTCIILHNMIIEDERGLHLPEWTPPREEVVQTPTRLDTVDLRANFVASRLRVIRDEVSHAKLQRDLVDHVWMFSGEGEED